MSINTKYKFELNLILIEGVLNSIELSNNKSIKQLKNIILSENGLLMGTDLEDSFKDIINILYELKLINIKKENTIEILCKSHEVVSYIMIHSYNSSIQNKVDSLLKDRKYFSPLKYKKHEIIDNKVKKRPTLF